MCSPFFLVPLLLLAKVYGEGVLVVARFGAALVYGTALDGNLSKNRTQDPYKSWSGASDPSDENA